MIGLDTNVLLRALIDESVWPEDSPGQMRAVLSNPANGTPSANPTTDRIGVMLVR